MRQAIAVFIFLCSPLLLSASLITNGDFETGDFTGWTSSGFATVICSAGYAESGNCAVSMDTNAVVSQTINTVAGAAYTFDFWYWIAGEQFDVKWDGSSVFSTHGSVAWTHEIFDVTASSSSTTVEFDATTFSTPTMRLDNVSVLADAPEPSTALLLLAPAVLLWMRRRKA